MPSRGVLPWSTATKAHQFIMDCTLKHRNIKGCTLKGKMFQRCAIWETACARSCHKLCGNTLKCSKTCNLKFARTWLIWQMVWHFFYTLWLPSMHSWCMMCTPCKTPNAQAALYLHSEHQMHLVMRDNHFNSTQRCSTSTGWWSLPTALHLVCCRSISQSLSTIVCEPQFIYGIKRCSNKQTSTLCDSHCGNKHARAHICRRCPHPLSALCSPFASWNARQSYIYYIILSNAEHAI